ncbi:MATE family efflux transporter [Oceanotoga teriensis]|uniref:MATE family efflux transporter n=1 Tax=Oceanotoga teriensis TaxID=515440 RepID=UPI0027141D0A|nr:MATE family efflux transporter [Oceanotoga teriensis]MDO7977476.1 MATE family efflux transporter [Oceanotoga teriensis]
MKLHRYIIPSVTSMWIYSFYTITDGVFVGRGVGADALSAVNISLPYINIIFAIGVMIAIGGSNLIGIELGKGNKKSANNLFMNVLFISFFTSIIFSFLGHIFLDQIVEFLGAKGEIKHLAKDYLSIVIYFNVFYMTSYAMEVLVKIDGFPHLSMFGNILSAIINIFLDYLFIIKLDFGIKGAAIATGLAQLTGFLFFFFHFFKGYNLKFKKFKFSFKKFIYINKLGFQDFLAELSSGLIILIMNKNIIETLGNKGLITFSIIAYFNTFALMSFIGVSHGMQPVVSFLFGKKKIKRVLINFKKSFITSISSGIIAFTIFFSFSDKIALIFLKDDSIIQLASHGMKIYAFAFLFMCINIVSGGYFTSIKKPEIAITISILRSFIFIFLSEFILKNLYFIDFKDYGIWLIIPLSEFLTSIYSIINVKISVKKGKKIIYNINNK